MTDSNAQPTKCSKSGFCPTVQRSVEPPSATEAAIRADQRQKDVEIARNVAAEYERDNADTVDTIMHQMYAHMAAGARAAAAAVERAAERGEETK